MLETIQTPLALLFAAYILGAGYLAFLSLIKEDIHTIKEFDKFMFSLTFGALAFAITLGIFKINLNFNDNNSIMEFVTYSPLIFFVNFFIARVLMEFWANLNDKIFNQ